MWIRLIGRWNVAFVDCNRIQMMETIFYIFDNVDLALCLARNSESSKRNRLKFIDSFECYFVGTSNVVRFLYRTLFVLCILKMDTFETSTYLPTSRTQTVYQNDWTTQPLNKIYILVSTSSFNNKSVSVYVNSFTLSRMKIKKKEKTNKKTSRKRRRRRRRCSRVEEKDGKIAGNIRYLNKIS